MIFKVDESKLFISLIESTDTEYLDLKNWLVKEVRNFWFIKKQMEKKGQFWFTGKIDFFGNGNTISVGLWKKIRDLCIKNGYECKIKGIKNIIEFEFDEDYFRNWVYKFFENKDKKPYEWQIDACIKILKYRRSVSELPTGSGKTLVLFTILAFLKSQGICNRFMIVVPNINLVGQTLSDFYEYNNDPQLNVRFKEQVFFGTETKDVNTETDLLIGTFHSLVKLEKDIFKTVDCVVVDECHYAKSNSVKQICAKLVNCHYRIGLSGTTMADEEDADAYTILGSLGPLCQRVKIKDLIDNEYLSNVQVKQFYLKYLSEKERKQLNVVKNQIDPRKMLALEKRIANTSEKRLNFLIKMVKELKGTTLILFHDIAGKFGKRVYEMLKDILEVDVYYIDGSVDTKIRDTIYNEGRSVEDNVIVASFGTTSTGINIPNINNVILSESSKSAVIVLQSIGRGTRMVEGKERLLVYDLVDDFRYEENNDKFKLKKTYINHLYKHGRKRCDIYMRNELPYEIKRIEL